MWLTDDMQSTSLLELLHPGMQRNISKTWLPVNSWRTCKHKRWHAKVTSEVVNLYSCTPLHLIIQASKLQYDSLRPVIYDANHPLKLIHSKGLWFAHNRKTEISNQLIYSQTRRVIVICRAVQEGARLNYLKTEWPGSQSNALRSAPHIEVDQR